MQFIDDDIDQLFRRAAEDYPLKTNTSDWNKVLNALQDKEQPKKKDKWRFFLLLLSAGLFWSINTYVGYIQNNPDQTILTKTNSISESKDQNTKETNNYLTTTNTSNQLPAEKKDLNKTTTIKQHNYIFLNQTSVARVENKTKASLPAKSFQDNLFVNQNKENIQTNKTVQPNDNSSEQQSSTIIAKKETTVNNNVADKTIDQIDSITTITVANAPKKAEQKKSKQSFYAGIIGGIDFSTIKLQKVSGTGYTAGVLLGYNLNKRWGIESGAYLDQKSYYSDGKYFNPKIYPNWDMKSVDGICRMIEIPLTVKYNFSTKQSGWFSTAGISSYLMKLENYDYTYTVGSSQPYGSYKTFKNSTNNLFSIIHFSVGYSKQIGKVGTFRAEPYFKIPLKGLGIGQLPISSTGINIGFTRTIF